ncbi:efflux RND transporter permease subunit [Shewanella fidelis]|uniref:Efflux RND transporter permease subunit n=1 Tax=Shewanella fidelis TaxID=173509 RepID=A0AAW8NL95_9GAMM|nr:efflux RND transporter permease subunit [Shewanella fidelis]MDR8523540.1 efflux RND transporter permease subunit [Shewanella fidelis]MDW4810087.1 efflux RND transporter permease subunit [Shewanella fidelis]MDW4814232.1 efflux RND transporter permease subunit [Shewanella fidelis]MDW4822263.1 efflux RND transporter permease subunit [Shewanella fidelis]MDW4826354.1 efflux RND transporter permease subunit [Shewanella fidelis]
MSIIKTAVNRPVTVWMFMFAVILFGMVGFSRLAVKLLPDLSYPTITIRTQYVGAAPVEVEQLVSKPIEEAAGIVKGLRKISSISRSGMSDVVLEFEWGTDMDMASLDVREKLDTIELPLDVKKPLLLRFNPNLDPIVRLALAAPVADSANGEMSQTQLKQMRTYAEEELKRQLESLTGVAAVRLSGGLQQEVHIQLNQQKLTQLNLSAELIRNRIAEENINLSAGKVIQGDKEYLVRTLNQFNSLDELGQIVIYRDEQTLVRLFEVATIVDAFKERNDVTRIGDKESIELAIYKEGDANTVAVARKVTSELNKLNASNAKGELSVIYDQSEFIKSAVKEVTSAALIGSLLAMLVIYLFLRDIIPTLIISISIPFSVIATFNMMYFADISLNIMSLGGIALAVGLLVDNAIVVLENIDRCKSLGMNRLDAAVTGTKEVAGAIFASTLTTLAVFIPLVFVDGVAGALFSDQALTVTFALLASLLVALTTIPMLASREGFKALPPLLEKAAKPKPTTKMAKLKHYSATVFSFPFVLLFNYLPSALLTLTLIITRSVSWLTGLVMRPISAAFNWCYRVIENLYHKLLAAALRFRALTLVMALTVTASAALLVPRLGMELIPPMNQGEFYVEILLPPGTEVTQTDRVLRKLALSIKDRADVKHAYSQAGSGGLMTSDTSRGGENWGRLQVVLSDPNAFDAVADKLRTTAMRIPELEAKVQHPELFSFKTPLEIELIGYDLDQLKQTADNLVNALDDSDRFADINTSLRDGQPELSIRFDHQRLAALGMDAPMVANRIAQRIGGTVASQYTVRDRKIDILVRSELDERDQISDIDAMIINPNSSHPISLSAVADVSLKLGPSAINRISQQRVAIVSANLAYGDLSDAVMTAREILAQQTLPTSIQTRFGGQNEEMEHSFKSLQIALVLAVFLVYLVMASQFESLLHPLLILIAVPMAVGGSIFGLFITQTHLSVVVFIGLIMLAGIVVNNAIVLVDRINQLRQSGEEKITAISNAAKSRLRPIIMTTMTTALGLSPMAFGLGDGSEVRAPMAITVIFGLCLSTVLTLVVIPVLYAVFDRKKFDSELNHTNNELTDPDHSSTLTGGQA